MASETGVDVPAVQAAARELARSADEFKQAVSTVRAELHRDQGCWSDDEIGKGFAQKYQEADQVQNNLAKLSNSLDEFAKQGLPEAVENIQQLDAQFGRELQKFADEIAHFRPTSDRDGDA